ncbi:E3 ubiquitin-protein ligase HUWE1-like isoform X2 [Antedon mediterranea]|uniref:E3 ubiquitin-protein ligase HUWE1-like isoform X2 n=1 Tax=Antedon mediterranea TaxID=105859 RepID=UPI003AF42DF1
MKMKIDKSKIKKTLSDVPADCKYLIDKLKSCDNLLQELKQIKSWNYGKCELYHWIDVLDRFDAILEEGCCTETLQSWQLFCDRPQNSATKELIHNILYFTSLLIEHSFSRHLYNSIEHLTTLLASSDLTTVLVVLNLIYVFSKRSNFIVKLSGDKRQELLKRLTYLADSWGGKENGFGLAECCQRGAKCPETATTLHFEFYSSQPESKSGKTSASHAVNVIHLENIDKHPKSPSLIMEELCTKYTVPKDKQMLLFTHVRLGNAFSDYEKRLLCVQARLQALSILVYTSAIPDSSSSLLYVGFIEELVDVLQLDDTNLVEINAAALRTLTSIIHLDRNPKLQNIVSATGAASYHGFLPVLVRRCIQAMTSPNEVAFPHSFATALFSFLYHLASYETGGEALVSCGMMESLLKVIRWSGHDEQLHTTFVTRAVRVVDLITNLDMSAFQTHGGLACFINRLEHEVELCKQDVPHIIYPSITTSRAREGSMSPIHQPEDVAMETNVASPSSVGSEAMETNQGPSTSREEAGTSKEQPKPKLRLQCFAQRAALFKSMLNFLKKAIPDAAFSDSIRHVMDGTLPSSLKHIISNAEYYGPSLFLLACELVIVYVFQEPSLLSSLQDTGLTDVMLNALLIKDVPATKEVLGSLPNIFSALCLNARGLAAFVQCKPFEKLFQVLLSPDYLPAMRRRRSSDPLGDTASALGNAMDELMRHQPSLRTDAMKAIIKLLEEIIVMGKDSKYQCSQSGSKVETVINQNIQSNSGDNDGSSDDEEDEEDMTMPPATATTSPKIEIQEQQSTDPEVKKPVPLVDYILNVMKFVEAILSNNTTDDHCREFIGQEGLVPLTGILSLPNLPVEFPSNPACQAVAGVCKAVLTLAREPQVLKQGLLHLSEVLKSLEPLHKSLEAPGGSVLLRELANAAPKTEEAILSAQRTPLLHAMGAAHAYITMFVHVCKVGQSDVRTMCVNHWGSDLGQTVLQGLSQLYSSLVWESTILLGLCTPNSLPETCDFGKVDMDKLLPKDGILDDALKNKKDDNNKEEGESMVQTPDSETVRTNSSTMMDIGESMSPMEVDEGRSDTPETKTKSKMSPQLTHQVKQIKPLLSAASRLGRALAELFGLLVKLSVGSPVRQRRGHHLQPNLADPSEAARTTATALTKLLSSGLSWQPPDYSPIPKFRLTFFICSVGFTSPMLFDDKKCPYHLMLQKFIVSGGLNALFETFDWALSMGGRVPTCEGLEHQDLPDGTGEFLDAWLMLVEKMVSTPAVLDSPHTLPNKSTTPSFVPFSPVQYLIKVHKAAYTAVMNLWNRKPLKTYGGRMSESMLAILCHILRGETRVREEREKEKNPQVAQAGTSSDAASLPFGIRSSSLPTAAALLGSGVLSRVGRRAELNADHIQQLLDMGFTREHAVDALNHTSSVEAATEWALTHAPRIQNLMMDLSEEDQMRRAIAMSLCDNIFMDGSDDDEKKKAEEEKKKQEELKAKEEKEKLREEEPIDKTLLDGFVKQMLPGCLQLLDELPDTVYRICDLLVVAYHRDGAEWRDSMLKSFIQQVIECATDLLKIAAPLTSSSTMSIDEWAQEVTTRPAASKLASRVLLFTLLFEEMREACAKTMQESGVMDVLVQLLDSVQQCLCAATTPTTPKWLAPLLLLIDLFEKASISSKRRLQSLKVSSHTWKWFDDTMGRWCNYSNSNNKTIDEAYYSGKTSIRFAAGRRKYIVHYNNFVQVNEETGNRRPIMLALPDKKDEKSESDKKEATSKEKDKKEATPKESKKSAFLKGAKYTESKASTDIEAAKVVMIDGLVADQITLLLRTCVRLISIPVEPDTLHAVLRLSLRLTRQHHYALQFAELGGAKMLLSLTQLSVFNGALSLITLMLRHIMEEPNVLKHTIDEVVSTTANHGVGSSSCGVGAGSIGSRELHFVLRVLGPAACRNEAMFLECARNSLRIALPPPPKRGEDDESRYNGPNVAQIVKSSTPKSYTPPALEGPIKQVLCDILNALVEPEEPKEESEATVMPRMPLQEMESAGLGLREIGDEFLRQYAQTERPPLVQRLDSCTESASLDEENNESASQSESTAESSQTTSSSIKPRPTKAKPLLPKSALLRLLAELAKSYPGCALMIAQYQLTTDQAVTIKQDCSVLGYILDNLLPQCQTAGDADCPPLARVLLARLAASNHSPEAQNLLVNEVKAALSRALALSESAEKHCRVQALTILISVMIDACPPSGGFQSTRTPQLNQMNNIIRILVRKGLATDLARIMHNLDLSSPSVAATVNSALKPLETLSRIVNQPTSGATKAGGKNKAARTDGQAAVDRNQANLLEMNETEPSDLLTQEPNTQDTSNAEAAFDQMMDELMQRSPTTAPEILGETLIATSPRRLSPRYHGESQEEMMISIADEGDVAIEQALADTEMFSHHSNEDDTPVVDDDVADDDIGPETESEDSDDQQDIDDEDEEEEEDDEEGSDMEADEYDEYDEEMDDPYMGVGDDRNLFFQLDEMFPSVPGSLRAYQLPISMHDDVNANDVQGPSIPPPPSTMSRSHPLLVRHADHPTLTQTVGRGHRGGRQRTHRHAPTTIHVYNTGSSRHPNPPAILQRLLGPSTAADVLQLTTNTIGNVQTRVYVSDIHQSDAQDGMMDDFFQDFSISSGGGGSVPSTLSRWAEESRVLDGESVHDCVQVLKPSILSVLNKHKDVEITERKEKRKKQKEEEEKKKAEESKKRAEEKKKAEAAKTDSEMKQAEGGATDEARGTSRDDENMEVGDSGSLSTPTTTTSSSSLPTSSSLLDPVELLRTATSNSTSQVISSFLESMVTEAMGEITPPSSTPSSVAMATSNTGATSTTTSSSGVDLASLITVTASSSGVDLASLITVTASSAASATTVSSSLQESPIFSLPTTSSSLMDVRPAPEVQQPDVPVPGTNVTTGITIATTVTSTVASISTTTTTVASAGPSTTQAPSEGLPEGVDPSFLAALPDNIRQEVLREHLGLRASQAAAATTTTTSTAAAASSSSTPSTSTRVNPEFLAALPPHIQEEVLAQEQAERDRQNAQQLGSQAAADPVDPAAFIRNLPSSLRQTILADIDDSVLAVMPPEIAAEARSLRQNIEIQHRRLMQERLLRETGMLSAIGRNSATSSRLGGVNYYQLAVPRQGNSWAWTSSNARNIQSRGASNTAVTQFRGRQLIDQEALACLLVLLFVNEPKLNTARLHKVLRNLSYHVATREWILQALLSILERTRTGELKTSPEGPIPLFRNESNSGRPSQTSWLSISMSAALGCRAGVFQAQRTSKKTSDRQTSLICIHPQAAPVVFKHALEAMVSLAKVFPSQFVPQKATESETCKEEPKTSSSDKTIDESQTPKQDSNQQTTPSKSKVDYDFWDVLLKLDSSSVGKKGKSSLKNSSVSTDRASSSTPQESPLATIMGMLVHPLVQRSSTLTDRLLHLLYLASLALPEKKDSISSLGLPSLRRPHGTRNLSFGRRSLLQQHVAALSGTTPMDTASVTDSGSSSSTKSPNKKDEKKEESVDPVVEEKLLKLVVEVLTSHRCSEDGLITAINLLQRLSAGHSATRQVVLLLLLDGAKHLGNILCDDITQLLEEVRKFQSEPSTEGDANDEPVASTSSGLSELYSRNVKVVVGPSTSSKRQPGEFELRLPSMSLFTSKTSHQNCFLRILKVVIQLRESARKSGRSQRNTERTLGVSNLAATVAALEAEANEIMQLMNRRGLVSEASRSLVEAGREAADAGSGSSADQTATSTAATSGTSAGATSSESPMEVDQPARGATAASTEPGTSTSTESSVEQESEKTPRLSEQLALDNLWETLSDCLSSLSETPDHHAVLVLQPAVEAFFLVHAAEKATENPLSGLTAKEGNETDPSSPMINTPGSSTSLANFFSREASVTSIVTPSMPPDTQKFLKFAETHRDILNQILRQSTTHLSEGPFSVLVNHTRILDFDVKRRYFRQELERIDLGMRREDMAIHVKREHVFEDSYRELHRRSPEEWKNRFYVVFEGEEGQDAGGLLREWYLIISREIFNPNYALFRTSPGDRVTYIPNPSSHFNSNHLSYFKFVGRIIAKAIYDNKLLDCYFSRSFYKHILGKNVTYTDMESEDYSFYQGLVFLLEHSVADLGYELTFSAEVQEFGVTEVRDLKPNGRNIVVTAENKHEYVHLVCQMRMTGAIRKQIDSFLEGFYDIIPKKLIGIFNEQELELLVSGLPTIDIDDLKSNTEYHKYQANSLQTQWFWRALRSFDQADRAKFLQFVTGTSKVPLQGFATLEGMNGPQKFQIHRDDRSTNRLPVAHTCFNQLDLPAYETYDKLRSMLLLATNECTEGFGLA